MPFRPNHPEERSRIEERIAELDAHITSMQNYAAVLRQELAQGQWCSDADYSKIPKPEPSCYICAFQRPIIDKCSKGHEYGTACSDYRHYSKGMGG